jgi:ABC-type multidrug transport system fused ATPase/permease subunit
MGGKMSTGFGKKLGTPDIFSARQSISTGHGRRLPMKKKPAPPTTIWKSFVRICHFMGSERKFFIWAYSLAVVDAICQASVPLYFRHIINALEQSPQTFLQTTFGPAVLAAIALIVIFFPAAYFFHVFAAIATARLCRNLQVALHEHVQTLSADFFQRTHVGEISSRINQDLDQVNGSASVLSHFVWALIMVVFSMACMFAIHWPLAVIMTLIVAATAWITKIFSDKVREMSRQVRDASGALTALVTEYISINLLIKAYSREEMAGARVRRQSNMVRKRREHLSWKQFLFTDTLQIIIRFGAPLLLLFLGGVFVARDQMRIGDLVAFWGYWLILGGTVTSLLSLVTQIYASLASVDRIFDFFDETPMVRNKPGAEPVTSVQGRIDFENVLFQYPGQRGGPVIRNLSLTVEAGRRVALVGPSGAGKSTLIQLILRFYDPVEGAVKIDGKDLRDLEQRSLRSHIGVVPQESIFFSGTIQDNLRLARENASETEMIAALKAANAWEFVRTMPGGLQAELGERGVRLSGGQRQRLSIARVFLKNPPILLLDEATSALDSQSEQLVQEAMGRLLAGRTSITIAHRLSTVTHCDEIFVMKDGEVVARGTHGQLLESCPFYRELCARQGLAGVHD